MNTERLGEVDYAIQLLISRSKKIVHQRRLKPAYLDDSEDANLFTEKRKERPIVKKIGMM